MKLPAIEYGSVQNAVAPALGRVSQAVGGLSDTVRAGLDAFGQELVRTQSQKAAADLSAGLADLEASIERTPYLTTQQVRDALGDDVEGLPSEVKSQITRKALDMRSGEMVDVDRDDVPSWAVAGAIFSKRSKELVKLASGGMSVGAGWQARFEAGAAEDVHARQVRLEQGQFRAMLGDQRKTQAETIESHLRAGNWDAAQNVITTSKAFEPAEKEQLVGAVELAQQKRPLEDLVLKGIESTRDVLEAGKLIAGLESGDGFARLEEKDRIDWKRRLEAEVKGFEQDQKEAVANRFKEADETARNGILDAYIQAAGKQLPRSLIPTPGTVSSSTLQWAIGLVESTRPGQKAVETDLKAYAELTGLATTNPEQFKNADLAPYFSRLSVPDARHFIDLQRTLKTEGPNGVKYTSFFGPQEETNTRLAFHGLHVTGKDAEDDAAAVGYVQREVNRALFNATRAKAGKGSSAPLTPAEQTAIVTPLVDKLVNAKAWKAEAKGSGIPVDYSMAVKDSTMRRGKGVAVDEQKDTYEIFQARQNDIAIGWNRNAGTRALTPDDELRIFDIVWTKGEQIREALKTAGKPAGSTAITDMAVRAYLRGVQ